MSPTPLTSFARRRGAALPAVLILVILVIALTYAVLSLSIADAKAVREKEERRIAFYLAEGGVEAAKWEITADEDPDGDGVGTKTVTTTAGDYVVTATDLGGGIYEVTSSGTAGGRTVTINTTVQLIIDPPSGPEGAFVTVGAFGPDPTLQFGPSTNFILDGGDAPALAFSNATAKTKVTAEINDAISSGYVSSGDITGNGLTGTSSFETWGEGSGAFDSVWSDFNTYAAGVKAGAASGTIPSSGGTLGSAGSPVKLKIGSGKKLSSGTLTGYGTLVIDRDFTIEAGATLNWNGDIYIGGDASNDTVLTVNGRLNQTGNLVVWSGSSRNAKMSATSLSTVNITGSLSLLTNYTQSTKVEFYVENDFTVNGLVTNVAKIHQTEFKPGSNAHITGSFHWGLKSSELLFKAEDGFEVTYDSDLVESSLLAIEGIGIDADFPASAGAAGARSTVTYGWRVAGESYESYGN
jgi:hypothetical protein